jgi:hypothetical protein
VNSKKGRDEQTPIIGYQPISLNVQNEIFIIIAAAFALSGLISLLLALGKHLSWFLTIAAISYYSITFS